MVWGVHRAAIVTGSFGGSTFLGMLPTGDFYILSGCSTWPAGELSP